MVALSLSDRLLMNSVAVNFRFSQPQLQYDTNLSPFSFPWGFSNRIKISYFAFVVVVVFNLIKKENRLNGERNL